ncbi:MAG: hypothetical protein QME28_08780 [Candidatus Saccharicenans sp.]|nr:hypothetical protein [Candidatus Saccharicenans sp.]
MTEKRIEFARTVIRTFSFLALVTAVFLVVLILLSKIIAGPDSRMQELAGTDFFIKYALFITLSALIFGLLGLLIASGIRRGQPWSWPAALVISVLLVCLFPLGTPFGIKILVDLLSRQVREWFRSSGRPVPPISGGRAEAFRLNAGDFLSTGEETGKK